MCDLEIDFLPKYTSMPALLNLPRTFQEKRESGQNIQMKIRCIKHFDRQGSVLVMYRLNKKFQLIMIGVETSPTTVVHSVGEEGGGVSVVGS